jgi:hypothetical protein
MVARLAETVPQTPAETVRTMLNMLLGEQLMDLVPRQPAMTVRPTGEGNATAREILDPELVRAPSGPLTVELVWYPGIRRRPLRECGVTG